MYKKKRAEEAMRNRPVKQRSSLDSASIPVSTLASSGDNLEANQIFPPQVTFGQDVSSQK